MFILRVVEMFQLGFKESQFDALVK